MTTTFWRVSFGAYTLGIEVVGSQPDCPYFHKWLTDFCTQTRMASDPSVAARQIGGEVESRWPGRSYWVEVARTDRLGVLRLEATVTREVKH